MHILHNGITLGECKVVMSLSQAKQVREVLNRLLEKEVDTLHVLTFQDDTGIAVTIDETDGSRLPATTAPSRADAVSGERLRG